MISLNNYSYSERLNVLLCIIEGRDHIISHQSGDIIRYSLRVSEANGLTVPDLTPNANLIFCQKMSTITL